MKKLVLTLIIAAGISPAARACIAGSVEVVTGAICYYQYCILLTDCVTLPGECGGCLRGDAATPPTILEQRSQLADRKEEDTWAL